MFVTKIQVVFRIKWRLIFQQLYKLYTYIHIDENIVGLEALDTFLENMNDEQLDSLFHSINLLDFNLNNNVDF